MALNGTHITALKEACGKQMDEVAEPTRFVGLDVHRRYATIAAVDSKQRVMLTARRVDFEDFAAWIRKHLRPTDAVALESTTNAWFLHDLLLPLVTSVTVANPIQSSANRQGPGKDGPPGRAGAGAAARSRTVTQCVGSTTRGPAVALAGGSSPAAGQAANAGSQPVAGVLFRHNLVAPSGEAFGLKQRLWWEDLDLPACETLQVRHDLAILDHLQPLIKEAETELVRQSTLERWAEQSAFLVQLPGIGVLNAMLLLAAIGDIERFASPHKLVGYAGLGARVHSSGEEHYGGRITKQGRQEIRSTMVEAAWVAVGSHPYWKGLFQRLAARIGRLKAIVAIARKLLVVVWHVLTEQVADREAMSAQVAGKFLEWSWKIGRTNRAGVSTADFIRRELQRLQIGADLTSVTRGTRTFRIATPEGLTAAGK